MNPQNKNRQGVFFYLLKNLKDNSNYFKYHDGKGKKLPKINEAFLNEGPGYNSSTEMLTTSKIVFNDTTWTIVYAMAPLYMRHMAIEKKKFSKTDYVLLFLEGSHVAGRKKYLLNVYGDVFPCLDDHPCSNCMMYSTEKDKCTSCEECEQIEKEEELEEWRQLNLDMFNLHKQGIPKKYHRLFLTERDPAKQMIIMANLLQIAETLETERERIDEDTLIGRRRSPQKEKIIEKKTPRVIFTEEDFPPLGH